MLGPKAKQVIDIVVDFLNNGDYIEARQVWSVLTALRGPDLESGSSAETIKLDYTCKIRSAIGMKKDADPSDGIIYHRMNCRLNDTALPSINDVYNDKRIEELYHFRAHIANALVALTHQESVNDQCPTDS